MISLFSTLSMLSGMIFPEFASIANITMCYYGVTAEAVNWTCMIYMATYIILIFPVCWLMSKVGLRMTVLAGSVCNTVAVAVQFASLTPDSFSFVMLSSFFASLSNVFVLSIPPCLAATWFPSKEISRACAMGVFGNQLGVALGFVVPPLFIPGDCSKSGFVLIMEGKKMLSILLTAANAIVLLLIVFTFQNEPKHPPSAAQATKKDIQESSLKTLWSMARNVNFILVFIMYGLIVGTYFAIATLLNSIMVPYFQNAEMEIGWMGLLVIVTGLVGSIIAGFILDYTHRFKETTMSICFMSFVSCVVFSCLLPMKTLWISFLTISILGFFLTSFLPVGFEYGIEVTYPESEIMSAGLLNTSTMIFGMIITQLASAPFITGPTYTNIVLCAALFTGTVISYFITKDYRRSKKDVEITCNSKL